MTVAYDGHDQPTEALFHDASHGLVLRVTFTRDSHRRLLEEHAHFGGETPFPSATTLDRASPEDRSKLVALLASAFADHTFSTTTYAYDQDGRLVERVRRMGQLSERRETFRYDVVERGQR